MTMNDEATQAVLRVGQIVGALEVLVRTLIASGAVPQAHIERLLDERLRTARTPAERIAIAMLAKSLRDGCEAGLAVAEQGSTTSGGRTPTVH